MIPFPFNENWFSFFVADHLLVGQLCTNPKSNRSLLSCLKVTQYSTSEIRDAPLYNSCSLLIHIMTTGPLPAPSKCKSGRFNVPRGMKTKFMLWSLVWFQVRATSCHLTSSKSAWKSTPKCTWMYVLKCVVIPWCNQVAGGRLWVWQLDSTLAHKSKETLAWLQECYDFVAFSHGPPSSPNLNPLDYFVWSYVKNTTNMTSHNTKASLITAICRVFAELPASSHRHLWKRHAPSSGSVSRWWLRLKVATLNRCQLYYIIKLPELIFSIKVLK